jgi:hypothetical protein
MLKIDPIGFLAWQAATWHATWWIMAWPLGWVVAWGAPALGGDEGAVLRFPSERLAANQGPRWHGDAQIIPLQARD